MSLKSGKKWVTWYKFEQSDWFGINYHIGILVYRDRKYVENFSRIPKPIYYLLPSDPDNTVKDKTIKIRLNKSATDKVPSSCCILWTEEHQKVLDNLIEKLVNPQIMAYPKFTDQCILHTDAADTGLGAILYQHQKGVFRIIAYDSRTLSSAEKNYHLHSGQLDFLALKCSVCEQFHNDLYYIPLCTVFTDNNMFYHLQN